MARRQGQTRREKERLRLLEAGTDDHYEDVELYDHEYEDREHDVDWYRQLANEREPSLPIVELGAGSGRVTCPLVEDGHRVIAVDRKDTMLAMLQRRLTEQSTRDKVQVVEADMRKLPLPDASTELVISPFNALMHLYTWQDLLRCFQEVTRVLMPGGVFAFDVELPDLEWLRWDPDKRHAVTRFTHPRTGEKLVYSTNHRYDPRTQVCHIRLYYDDAPPKGRRFVPPDKPRKLVHLAHRQIFPQEVGLLAHAAGLTLLDHTGDFEGVSLGPAVQSQVVLCTKPRS